MRTIYKYELRQLGVNEIETYEGATVLAAHEQGDTVVVHVLLDTRAPLTKAEFAVIPTGRAIMDFVKNINVVHAESYVDTVMAASGTLVWHVFSLTLPVAK